MSTLEQKSVISNLIFNSELKPNNNNHPWLFSVLAILKQAGAHGCLIPVLQQLNQRNPNVSLNLVSTDTAEERLTDDATPRLKLETIPDGVQFVLLSASESNFEIDELKNALRINPNLKIIVVEDIPGGVLSLLQKLHSNRLVPSLILGATKKQTKNYVDLAEKWWGGLDNKPVVVPIGATGFMKPAKSEGATNIAAEKERVRTALGIDFDT